jgi:hypothetical protein
MSWLLNIDPSKKKAFNQWLIICWNILERLKIKFKIFTRTKKIIEH